MYKSKYLKINNKIKYAIFCCIYLLLYPLCSFYCNIRKIWIICERKDEAQDNGYVFFKFIRENHPEINIVYLIKRNSSDFDKVKSLGKTIEFGSLRHFFLMIGAPVKISSHLFGYSPWVQSSLYYRRNKTRHVHIFLQHGITKNLHEGLFSETCNSLKLFVCGAKPEYDSVYNDFHYRNDVPQYTGFPRYDLLNTFKCKNQILFMPTWRASLQSLNNAEFTKSSFYKNWAKLIDSKDLREFLFAKGIEGKFYLHSSFQKFSNCFKDNDVFKIIKHNESNVQELLKDSLLLVTDFSSVFFDFAYMKKPLVYFQFDETEYYKTHYQKGYFDYRKDGFGDVCVTYDSVLQSIKNIINNSFAVENKYLVRRNIFFTLDANHNCERVFERIKCLIK